MDVVTLFFAVIISLLLTKYLPPHATYLETVRNLKDEIQKVLSKIAEFGGELTGLKSEFSTEIEKAIDEINKIKEQEATGVGEQLQKIVSKVESFDEAFQSLKNEVAKEIQKTSEAISKLDAQKASSGGAEEIQKVASQLNGIDEKLQDLKKELESEIKNATSELAKLSSLQPSDGSEKVNEILSKISLLEGNIGNIKSEIANEIQKISGEIGQLKTQNDIVTAFIEEAKKSHLPEKFELYNGLWLSLVELKTIVNELWEYPSREKAKKLAKQVLETRKMLEQSAIFIPEALFNKLMDIIQEFESIQFGKVSLVKLRNVAVKNKDFPENDLKSGLKDSIQIKDNYISALEELKKYIKENVVEA